MPDASIVGYCPMGCGQTLFVGSGGHITCSLIGCPRPTAADELLGDRETEHLVKFGPKTFTVRHPLRERLDGDLWDCQLHGDIKALDGPPVQPGRYRAVKVDGRWSWESLPVSPEGDGNQ